ncbi:MAG: RICIN domain-containing protein [Clostridiales bacterium]|jgi:cell wall-associated NlpC family hydrolase|nr:RICIN domain-containing protein [Clostridiales bacterium]
MKRKSIAIIVLLVIIAQFTPTVYVYAANHEPIGTADFIERSSDGTVFIQGWVYDPDSPTSSISIHVYCDDTFLFELTTGFARDDVNNAFGITGKHGFSSYISMPQAGNVRIYAIDASGGNNPMFASKYLSAKSGSASAYASVDDGEYVVYFGSSNSVLDVQYKSTDNGSKVVLGEWNGGSNQVWSFTKQSDGSYKLSPIHSPDKSLEVSNNGTSNSSRAQIWTSHNGSSSRWYLVKNGDYYSFLNVNAKSSGVDLYLDVDNGGTANGTLVHTWQNNAGSTSRFRLVKQSNVPKPVVVPAPPSPVGWPTLSTTEYAIAIAPANIDVFTSSSLKTRGTSDPRKEYSAYVSYGDEVYVYEIRADYALVNYPTSSGRRTGYIRTRDLADTSAPLEKILNGNASNITTYRTAGGSNYGYTERGDDVYVLRSQNGWCQILYTASNAYQAYKIGWISNSGYSSLAGTKLSYDSYSTVNATRNQVVEKARSLVNRVPYFWGGKYHSIGESSEWRKLRTVTASGSRTSGHRIPYGLDCSGFVDWVFYQFGYVGFTNKNAATQINSISKISKSELKPGDIGWTSGHIGIYAGNGYWIHASGNSPATLSDSLYCEGGKVIYDTYSGFTRFGRIGKFAGE